ncbi:MAG: hypothetical protein ACYTGC_11760, partial [Planctomycetota bacterium]
MITKLALGAGCIVVGWTAPSLTAAGPAPHDQPADPIQTLRRAHPEARILRQAAQVRRVYGPGLSRGDSAEQSAEQFRLQHAVALGAEPADLQPEV